MRKEDFLTLRWNNILTLGMGLLMLIYIYLVLTTSVLSDGVAFWGLVVLGAIYWTIVEQLSNMRFAWINQDSVKDVPTKQNSINRTIYIAYNLVWWIPIVLAIFKIIDYQTAFIALFVLTAIRAVINLFRNNVLNPQQAENFPLRSVWLSQWHILFIEYLPISLESQVQILPDSWKGLSKILDNLLGENGDLNQKWRGWDLNPRHKAYESSALPTELPRQ